MRGNRRILRLLSTNYEGSFSQLFDAYESVNEFLNAVETGEFGNQIKIYGYNKDLYDGDYIFKIDRFNPDVTKRLDQTSNDNLIWSYEKKKTNIGELDCIVAYSKIVYIDKVVAVVELSIPIQMITKIRTGVTNSDRMILLKVNDTKIIPIGSQNTDVNNVLKEFEESDMVSGYKIISQKIASTGMVVHMLIPNNEIIQQIQKLIIWLIMIGIILLVLIVWSIKMTTKLLTRRLGNIIDVVINTDMNNWTEENDTILYKTDEFDEILLRFYEYRSMIREFYGRVSKYERDLKTMEINLLQERINPHFLYNTLSAIKWVSADETLKRVINDLVSYYRIVLNKGSISLMIKKELEMIERYVDIQRFAYNLDFHFEIRIEKEVENKFIIKQLLQPVVENAILHGINKMKCGGEIIIDIRTEVHNIILEVKDNGRGMDDETVEKILKGELKDVIGGYGMRNIMERIRSYYGNDYGVSIKSTPNVGTTVTMKIPIVDK